MRRILIIGCAGAGKSTLARRLGDRLGLEVTHLDREFWQSGWVQRPRAEFLTRLDTLLAGEAWIMDGNFDSTLSLRLIRADTVIFLDFPRWRCLTAVLWRTVTLHGRVRPDMTPGCPEHVDWSFLLWIWNYRRSARPEILRQLESAHGRKVVILNSRSAVRSWLEDLNPGLA